MSQHVSAAGKSIWQCLSVESENHLSHSQVHPDTPGPRRPVPDPPIRSHTIEGEFMRTDPTTSRFDAWKGRVDTCRALVSRARCRMSVGRSWVRLGDKRRRRLTRALLAASRGTCDRPDIDVKQKRGLAEVRVGGAGNVRGEKGK
eukprot:1835289-Rhodomonas_salina.3